MATPRRDEEEGLDKPRVCRSVAVLRRGVVLYTYMCFLSCFAIPLFRRLVYWTNKDPISL